MTDPEHIDPSEPRVPEFEGEADPLNDVPSMGGEVVETEAAPDFAEFGNEAPMGSAATPLTAVKEVPVRVQAVLGRARVSVGELIRMQSGMVLELDRRVGEPVDVFVNNRLVARGEVMLVDHALGVTLTEIVRQDN